MPDTPQKAKGGKKNRKVGRSKTYCQWYRNHNIREKNKVRKLRKHVKRQPNERVGLQRLRDLEKLHHVGGK